jgi:hypothetical protein
MQPRKLTRDDIQRTLTRAVKDAVSFVEDEIAPERMKAERYFKGETDLGHEDGRSRVVATKCRDTVRAIKPVLMRVFLQTDKPVEFIPRTPQAVEAAEQATAFASYVFDRNDGFRVLSDAFHDALVKKAGVVKVTYDETPEVEIDEYTSLTPEHLAFFADEADVEVLEQEQAEDGTLSLKIARTSRKGRITFDSIPPEDFFIDRDARNIRDCHVCGHSTMSRVGDLVAMGFDFEQVFDLGTSASTGDAERQARTGWDDESEESANDPSMRPVLFTEAYMRMDIEGTGVPRLYRFLCAGENYTVLDHEPCDLNPFAVFEVDPEPHTFFGRSLVDIIVQDQDAATALLRGLLDSIAMANNPRVWAVEDQVNGDDLQNNEIGGIVRMKAPGMVGEFTIGAAASNALPAIQHYDEVIRAKTGVTGASMGMDADALQSQTAAGVNAAVQAASATAELIARNLAEGGMRQLFEKIAQLARQHPDAATVMRVNGRFVPIAPQSWTADMDVTANVGLGTGRHEERAAMLLQVAQTQFGIWQAYGPTNGLVSLTTIRNLQADLLALAGIHNADRYWLPMDPEREQMLMQQAAQAAQQQPAPSDPNMAFLQAEQMKVSARVMADREKAQLDMVKAQMQDDRERDRMEQDAVLRAAELAGKHSIAVNTQALRAQQQQPRPMPGQMPPQV